MSVVVWQFVSCGLSWFIVVLVMRGTKSDHLHCNAQPLSRSMYMYTLIHDRPITPPLVLVTHRHTLYKDQGGGVMGRSCMSLYMHMHMHMCYI